jgi:hypothetical protein
MRLTVLLRSFQVSVKLGYDEVVLEVASRPSPLPTKTIRSLIAESLNVDLIGVDGNPGEFRTLAKHTLSIFLPVNLGEGPTPRTRTTMSSIQANMKIRKI